MNGNRTGYQKAVTGSTADYGTSENLSYTFDAVNALTAISETDPRYACAVTSDANNNITQLDESMTGVPLPSPQTNHLCSIFTYDALNRLTLHQTKAWQTTPIADWYFTDRQFEYSGVGAILRSGWKHYKNGTTTSYQQSKQVYDQQTGNFVQNVSLGGSPTYGTRWSWAGAQNGPVAATSVAGPLFGPNADTTNQKAYNLNAAGGAGDPQRRTFINPTTEGDKRELFGQGRPMAKDSVAAWATGTVSAPQNIHMNSVTSHLAFEGTVAPTDYSRATDAREKGRIGIFGTGFSYAGSSGRVTSETLGRDLNPLGRGDGMAYVGGGQIVGRSAQILGRIAPALPTSTAKFGTGNSINNGCGSGPCPQTAASIQISTTASPTAFTQPPGIYPPSPGGIDWYACLCGRQVGCSTVVYGTAPGGGCCAECAVCWQSGFAITCCIRGGTGPCVGPVGDGVPGQGTSLLSPTAANSASFGWTSYQTVSSQVAATGQPVIPYSRTGSLPQCCGPNGLGGIAPSGGQSGTNNNGGGSGSGGTGSNGSGGNGGSNYPCLGMPNVGCLSPNKIPGWLDLCDYPAPQVQDLCLACSEGHPRKPCADRMMRCLGLLGLGLLLGDLSILLDIAMTVYGQYEHGGDFNAGDVWTVIEAIFRLLHKEVPKALEQWLPAAGLVCCVFRCGECDMDVKQKGCLTQSGYISWQKAGC